MKRPGVRRIVQGLCDHAWSLGAVAVAAERGVLDAIAAGPTPLSELAALADLELTTLRACVDVLCGLGLATLVDEAVHPNEPLHELGGKEGAKLLAADVRATLGGIFGAARQAALQEARVEGWLASDPVVVRAQSLVSEASSNKMSAMLGLLPELEQRLRQPHARMLDVGAGAGGLCLAFARAFPDLHVVGIEPAELACAEAREAAQRAGLADRIEVRQGLGQDLQEHDVFAAAYVAQMFIPEAALDAVLRSTLRALQPGGVLITGAVASLGNTMLAAISRFRSAVWGGGVRTGSDVVAALEHAGFADARSLPIGGSGGAFLPIVAHKA